MKNLARSWLEIHSHVMKTDQRGWLTLREGEVRPLSSATIAVALRAMSIATKILAKCTAAVGRLHVGWLCADGGG